MRIRVFLPICNSAIILNVKILKRTALILWLALIFFFSAQPSVESVETSNLFAEILYKVFGFMLPGSYTAEQFLLEYGGIIRKLAHFSEFLILGVLTHINFKDSPLYLMIAFDVCCAITDEIHQLFVDKRVGSFKDVLIDSAGALCGIFLCHLISKRCQKKSS